MSSQVVQQQVVQGLCNEVVEMSSQVVQEPFRTKLYVVQEPHTEVIQEPHNEVVQEPHNEVAQEPHNEVIQESHDEVIQESHDEVIQKPHNVVVQEPWNEVAYVSLYIMKITGIQLQCMPLFRYLSFTTQQYSI